MLEEDAINRSMANFKYPACWVEKERMLALCMPFRHRAVNPEHYDAKLKFWSDLISQYCKYKSDVTFTKAELGIAFKCGGQTPKCLDTVIDSLLGTHKIRIRSEFEIDPANGWIRWLVYNIMKRPLQRTIATVKSTVGLHTATESTTEYIHVEMLNQYCKMLQMNVLEKLEGKVVNYKTFLDVVTKNMIIAEQCLEMCLHKMAFEKRIGIEYQRNEKESIIKYIKVPSKQNKDVVITEVDKAVDSLHITQNKLMAQLEILEQEIEHKQERIQELLGKNNRNLAKVYLQKKKLLEHKYSKRSSVIHNIDLLLDNINEASTNGEIMNAYKNGVMALRTTMKQSGLNWDSVDDTLADVHETIEAHQEIHNRIGESELDENDNREIELELQQLLENSVADDTNEQIKVKEPAPVADSEDKASDINFDEKVENLIKFFNETDLNVSPSRDLERNNLKAKEFKEAMVASPT